MVFLSGAKSLHILLENIAEQYIKGKNYCFCNAEPHLTVCIFRNQEAMIMAGKNEKITLLYQYFVLQTPD